MICYHNTLTVLASNCLQYTETQVVYTTYSIQNTLTVYHIENTLTAQLILGNNQLFITKPSLDPDCSRRWQNQQDHGPANIQTIIIWCNL